jgi:hypothetical protein
MRRNVSGKLSEVCFARTTKTSSVDIIVHVSSEGFRQRDFDIPVAQSGSPVLSRIGEATTVYSEKEGFETIILYYLALTYYSSNIPQERKFSKLPY